MAVASIGDEAQATLAVTDETIDEFASLTGDENPIHTDERYAGETMFGGRVAHGILTAGVVSAALADLPGDIVYLSQDIEFTDPVRPGETVTATATVTEKMPNNRLRAETTAETASGIVLTGSAIVLSLPHNTD